MGNEAFELSEEANDLKESGDQHEVLYQIDK
jgi:hypothetical protein